MTCKNNGGNQKMKIERNLIKTYSFLLFAVRKHPNESAERVKDPAVFVAPSQEHLSDCHESKLLRMRKNC
jgi:hypothetical protein